MVEPGSRSPIRESCEDNGRIPPIQTRGWGLSEVQDPPVPRRLGRPRVGPVVGPPPRPVHDPEAGQETPLVTVGRRSTAGTEEGQGPSGRGVDIGTGVVHSPPLPPFATLGRDGFVVTYRFRRRGCHARLLTHVSLRRSRFASTLF